MTDHKSGAKRRGSVRPDRRDSLPAVPRAYDDLVTIGTVIKPHGVRGEVVVLPHSDRPERFPSLKEVFLPAGNGGVRAVKVEHTFPHKERFVVKLAGVDTMDDAERLRGMDLRIPEEDLAPLPEGSYYHHQLVGLDVVTDDGERIGTVAAIQEHSATPTVVIQGRFGRELLIPFVDDFVKDVDLAGKVMHVHVPDEDAVDSSPQSATRQAARRAPRSGAGRVAPSGGIHSRREVGRR